MKEGSIEQVGSKIHFTHIKSKSVTQARVPVSNNVKQSINNKTALKIFIFPLSSYSDKKNWKERINLAKRPPTSGRSHSQGRILGLA